MDDGFSSRYRELLLCGRSQSTSFIRNEAASHTDKSNNIWTVNISNLFD